MEDVQYLDVMLRTDELHRKIGAGLPKGMIMLVEGEDGGGKSIVAQRFLYGILKNGHTATLVCSEMTTKDFVNQMKSVEYDIHSYLTSGKFLYIPMFPRIGKVVPRTDFLERLMKAEQLFKNEVIIIDTLNSLIAETISKEELFKLISFLKKISNLDKTIIITANPGMLDPYFMNILRGMVDIHFKLEIKMVGGNLKRAIKIYRFRGSSITVASTLGFRVEPKIGFVIEIAAVA